MLLCDKRGVHPGGARIVVSLIRPEL
jgi:hypothetical protein